MASTVLHMSASLDGFIAGPDESPDVNPMGNDGGYLHGWFPAGVMPGDATPRDPSEALNSQIFDELNATGAIVAGSRWRRASSTSSSCTSSRCCSDRDAGSSTAWVPSTSSSSGCGCSRGSAA